MKKQVAMSIDHINSLFRGKATWFVERSEFERSTIVGFRCDKQTPVMRISDSVIEDAHAGALTYASKCIDLYTNHHRIVQPFEAQPTLTCGNCRAPVDVPTDGELNDFEFCERQSVLWAERAMKAKR